jgi:hypothetical protein
MAENVKLKRPEVAAKYDTTVEVDAFVNARGYSGMLSNVNEAGAQHIVESKAGLLVEKKPSKPVTNTEVK